LSVFVTYTCYAEATAAEETYCAITLPTFVFGTTWDYSDTTTKWNALTGGFCSGKSQSPINIVTADVKPIPAGTVDIAYDRDIELMMQKSNL
jgi:carbonic anhydrase